MRRFRMTWRAIAAALAVTAGVVGGEWLRGGTVHLSEILILFIFGAALYPVGLALWHRVRRQGNNKDLGQ
jgi:hypothetical protein